MSPIAFLLLAFGAVGHSILWLGLVNRIHALAIHRRLVDGRTGLCGIMLLVIPCGIAAVLIGIYPTPAAPSAHFVQITAWGYVVLSPAFVWLRLRNDFGGIGIPSEAARYWQITHRLCATPAIKTN